VIANRNFLFLSDCNLISINQPFPIPSCHLLSTDSGNYYSINIYESNVFRFHIRGGILSSPDPSSVLDISYMLNPSMELSQSSSSFPQGYHNLPHTVRILYTEAPHPRIKTTVAWKYSRKIYISNEHVQIFSCLCSLNNIVFQIFILAFTLS
jgi:hypothetical protein